MLMSSIGYADTCYDPNYDSYYTCAGDEYIAPINSAVLFQSIIYNNNNRYNNHRNHNYRNNEGYHGDNGNRRHH